MGLSLKYDEKYKKMPLKWFVSNRDRFLNCEND